MRQTIIEKAAVETKNGTNVANVEKSKIIENTTTFVAQPSSSSSDQLCCCTLLYFCSNQIVYPLLTWVHTSHSSHLIFFRALNILRKNPKILRALKNFHIWVFFLYRPIQHEDNEARKKDNTKTYASRVTPTSSG